MRSGNYNYIIITAIEKYTDHKIKAWGVAVPCCELVDCSGWLQGPSALEVAPLWALWGCGVQSLPLWAPLGSNKNKQK